MLQWNSVHIQSEQSSHHSISYILLKLLMSGYYLFLTADLFFEVYLELLVFSALSSELLCCLKEAKLNGEFKLTLSYLSEYK